jgi:hypothetical protein
MVCNFSEWYILGSENMTYLDFVLIEQWYIVRRKLNFPFLWDYVIFTEPKVWTIIEYNIDYI